MPGAPRVLELQLAPAELLGAGFRPKTRWSKPFEPEGAGGARGRWTAPRKYMSWGPASPGRSRVRWLKRSGSPWGSPEAPWLKRFAGAPEFRSRLNLKLK